MRLSSILGVAALIAFAAQPAQAGAWARGKGKAFLSTGSYSTWPDGRALERPDVYGTIYGEYGITNRLTLGVDLGSADAEKWSRTRAIGFLRYTLTRSEARNQFAIDLGVGQDESQTVMRAGLSFGRGFSFGKSNGWVSLDWATLHDFKTLEQSHSLEATLGTSWRKSKLMAQFSGYQNRKGDQTLTFTPSWAREMRPGLHLEVGVAFGIKGKPDHSLKVAVWRSF